MKALLTLGLVVLLTNCCAYADNSKPYPKCDPDTPHNCE